VREGERAHLSSNGSKVARSRDLTSIGFLVKISGFLPIWLRDILRPCSRRAWVIAWRARIIWWRLTRGRRIGRHYQTHRVIKISLGAGTNIRTDWMNTDFEPMTGEIIYVDVTKKFPFPESSVDYFHTEHMIEHISLSSAQCLLNECFRTLKPGGKIRIATPDVIRLGRLLIDADAQECVDYIKWSLERFPPAIDKSTSFTSCMVFNNFMHSWCHQFVYDETTLKALLAASGFVSMQRCEINESTDPQLAAQEMRDVAIGDAANRFETMVLEAMKPVKLT
jgi:predicted SAM-dependent methyltransferase